jgi:hypothetical protein
MPSGKSTPEQNLLVMGLFFFFGKDLHFASVELVLSVERSRDDRENEEFKAQF